MNLTLFFTAGTGIADWAAAGNLDRELAIYRRLATELGRINLLSYGGAQDRKFASQLTEFGLCPVSWRRRQEFTAAEAVLRHSGSLIRSAVFKTNQLRGAQIPIWLKRLYRKKLIVRCGFLHSFFTEKQSDDPDRISEAAELEKKSFEAADMIFVTSGWQRNYILERYGTSPETVKVVPNYVETDLFRPIPETAKRYNLVFVGRGTEQKNLHSLLMALAKLKQQGRNLSLLMVGSCGDNEELRELAARERLEVEFSGPAETSKLPELLNQAQAFILPSHYEGHPKALIEAMSCALPCIGAEVEGIQEEIIHGNTGFLCSTSPDSIASAIDQLFSNKELVSTLGLNAREHVIANYELEKILGIEKKYIQELCRC